MAFCRKCGAEIYDEAVICPKCGVPQQSIKESQYNDTGEAGWWLLSFLFPIIGIILCLVWKVTKPNCSNASKKGAIIGIVVYFMVLIGLFAFNGRSDSDYGKQRPGTETTAYYDFDNY